MGPCSPTDPGGNSTARKPLRGRSILLPYHSILLSRSFPGNLGTSLQTDSLLARAQLSKFCSSSSHPRRGNTRSRSCSMLAPPYFGDIAPLLVPSFVTHLRPQVYHGSMATHDWFPEIFGTLDTCTTLLTLVTSFGHPTPQGAILGDLSSVPQLLLQHSSALRKRAVGLTYAYSSTSVEHSSLLTTIPQPNSETVSEVLTSVKCS